MTSGARRQDDVHHARSAAATADDSEAGSHAGEVSGEDLSNVIIVTSKGATATGRLTFEGGTKPADLAGIRVSRDARRQRIAPMLGMAGRRGHGEGGRHVRAARPVGHAADPRDQSAAGMDAEVGARQRRGRDRHGRRIQARRGGQRARGRRDSKVTEVIGHGQAKQRTAGEGLHAGRLRRRARSAGRCRSAATSTARARIRKDGSR